MMFHVTTILPAQHPSAFAELGEVACVQTLLRTAPDARLSMAEVWVHPDGTCVALTTQSGMPRPTTSTSQPRP